MKVDTIKAVAVTLALMALAAVVMAVGISLLQHEPADATRAQVCAGLDSGKVDVSGDHKTITVTAPAGKLISGYCVKAGSVQQGNGPEYVTVDPPAASVTFGHSSGKDVSHWSVSYVDAPVSTTTTTEAPVTTTTTEAPVTTTTTEAPVTTTTTEAPPVSVCVGSGEAEVCTSSVLLPPSEPAEAVPGVPSFTG